MIINELRSFDEDFEWPEDSAGMSNFDHSISDGFEDFLRRDPRNWGQHAAWNFNGRVWFEAGLFHEVVSVFKVRREHFSAVSLSELMRIVNEEYGSE